MSAASALEVGAERIDRGVDAELGDRAVEHDGGVEVGERVCRRGVGEIVGGHVDGLERGDGALLGRGDALLQHAHLVGEGRLVADGRRRAAEQGGDLGAGLREAEDVVDEEQDVLVLLVAEVLGDGEGGEADAQAGARRLVHLAVNEGDLGLRDVILHDDLRLGHFVVEVVALAGALAHPGEHGVAAVRLGDVVDQLHDDDGLADARAAEGADLAAAHERADEVDDLDAGFEDGGLDVLVDERGRQAVDRIALLVGNRARGCRRGRR